MEAAIISAIVPGTITSHGMNTVQIDPLNYEKPQ